MHKQRNSSVELLRIISMFLIILHHFNVHGIFLSFHNHIPPTNIHILTAILSSGGKIGVDIFMIISGFFLIKQHFNKDKLVNLLGQMFFYSIILFVINLITQYIKITPLLILQSIFPFLYTGYWFINAYIIIYILINYINKLLCNLNKKELQHFILIITTLVFIIPTFLPKSLELLNNGLIICFVCYCIGGYLKLFPINFPHISTKKLSTIIIIINIIIVVSSEIILGYIGNILNSNLFLSHITMFAGDNSIFILLLSLGLVLYFINRKPFSNQLINKISSTTLGIYLIHDNIIVRHTLWEKILRLNLYHNYSFINLLFFELLGTLVIFIICCLIEYLRQRLFAMLFLKRKS